jgi:hypothetical protein
MMISGQKAGQLALKALGLPNAIDGTLVGNLSPERSLLLLFLLCDEREDSFFEF